VSRRGELWRVTAIEDRSECPPAGWPPCDVHGICFDCGALIHFTDGGSSRDFGSVDAVDASRLVAGRPARCADCRAGRANTRSR
jgi:hypothetical protein